MKVLIAGTGAFGREHLARLARRSDLVLAAADSDPRALAAAAGLAPLAEQGPDPLALLASFRPDAMIVATPAESHAPLARAALAQAVPVLVEKPLAPTAAEARELACLASRESSGAFILPGHVLRFSAPHRALHSLIATGALGRLLSITSRRFRDRDHARRYPGIDPILMTLVHDIDLALWYGGGRAATAHATRTPDRGAATLTCADVVSSAGTCWHLSTAWTHEGICAPDRVELVGTEGSAEWEAGGPIRLYGARQDMLPVPADDPLETEIAAFLEAVGQGPGALPITPGDAVAGLEAAEMILASMTCP